MTRYRECQRNHAAHLGSHVVDGCGEFMPAGDEGTPQSLRCAACNCHRSFHRREPSPTSTSTSTPVPVPIPARTSMPMRGGSMMITFGDGGVGVESSSEDYRAMEGYEGTTRKKRYRTKFTEEQKERMAETAEKIGWKMKKESEESVVELCNEIGIQRKVFKVWMHNNKQAFKRKLS